MSKGSVQRPVNVSREQLEKNWIKVFGKKETKNPSSKKK